MLLFKIHLCKSDGQQVVIYNRGLTAMQETSAEQLQWESKGLWTQERMAPLDYKAAGREMEGSLPGGGDSDHRAASCFHRAMVQFPL